MCKIFVVTDMSKIRKPKRVIEAIARNLAAYEQDGFGYTVQGEDGLFGERDTNVEGFVSQFERKVLNLPFVEASYNRFGTWSRPVGAGIFHGRTSTNDKTLLNTHPINKHDWSLIHNGVVNNEGPKYEMATTNDTEHLVHYMANGGISALSEHLSGYYAAAAIAPDGRLHIFRDKIAPLFWCEIETLGTYVVGTTKELIEEVCKDLKWKPSTIAPFNADTYVIMRDGVIESVNQFKSRGYSWRESQYASKSLGRTLSPFDDDDWYGREWRSSGDAPSQVIDATVSDAHHRTALAEASESAETRSHDSRSPLQYTEDETAFLNEVEHMDSTYVIYNYREERTELEDFLAMDDDEKLCCTVVRADGTVMDPNDYYTEKLYQGAVS